MNDSRIEADPTPRGSRRNSLMTAGSVGDTGWPEVHKTLLELVRDFESPVIGRRIAAARHLLMIGSCLGLPPVEPVGRDMSLPEVAVITSAHCQALEPPSALAPGFWVAGTLSQNHLSDGWADCLVGHCVLDEFPSPRAAFLELARIASAGAPVVLSGPASAVSIPGELPRWLSTVWPLQELVDDLHHSGFGEVIVTDLTSHLLARMNLPDGRFSPNLRWVILAGTRLP